MTEQKEKQRLEQLRRYARELAEEARKRKLTEDLTFISRHNLKIKPGHLEKTKRIAQSENISYKISSRLVRERVQHDNLDFTLPDISASRMKKIINIIMAISSTKSWQKEFECYLVDGYEEQLLELVEELSWSAFIQDIPLETFLESLDCVPKLQKRIL